MSRPLPLYSHFHTWPPNYLPSETGQVISSGSLHPVSRLDWSLKILGHHRVEVGSLQPASYRLPSLFPLQDTITRWDPLINKKAEGKTQLAVCSSSAKVKT